MNQIQRQKKLVSVRFTTGTDVPLKTIMQAVAANIPALAEVERTIADLKQGSQASANVWLMFKREIDAESRKQSGS